MNRSMAPANEEMEAGRPGLNNMDLLLKSLNPFPDLRCSRAPELINFELRLEKFLRSHKGKINSVTEDIKGENAVWRKLLEESLSEIEKKPHLKNVYDEFIGKHDSCISALTYRLAKTLGNDLVNFSQLLELFKGYFANHGDLRAEIRNDLSAARVRYVPNQSYVETLLYSQGFLALQAHKLAHKLWLNYRKNLALFIQKRVSEVFAVNILPEEKIESSMLLNKATGSFDGETVAGKNVTIYHGKVYVCLNKSLAKESPNHPANLVRERLNVKDGYFHQGFYRDEEATASGCQPHGAEISQDGGIQIAQADHGSANSTQLDSPLCNYKAPAPPGNIRNGNGQPLHCINDGASSSQARPTNRCYRLNVSSSANTFLPTGVELIRPADRGSTNSTQLASPMWNNTATSPPGNIRGGNGNPACYINEGASSSQGRSASGRNQLNLSRSANIFPPTIGQLIQPDDRDSTNSTQVASPLSITVCAANNTDRASGSSGNIQGSIRGAQYLTNGGAASSRVGPTNGRNRRKLSNLAKIFIPIAFALLLAPSAIWYGASSMSLSAHARILLILAEVFGFIGLLLCLGGYFTPPSSSSAAQWLTVVGCVAILCGYISIMFTQLL